MRCRNSQMPQNLPGSGHRFIRHKRVLRQQRRQRAPHVVQRECAVFPGRIGDRNRWQHHSRQPVRQGFQRGCPILRPRGQRVVPATVRRHVTGCSRIGEERNRALRFHQNQVPHTGQKRQSAFREIGHLRGFKTGAPAGEFCHIARRDNARSRGGTDSPRSIQSAEINAVTAQQNRCAGLTQQACRRVHHCLRRRA